MAPQSGNHGARGSMLETCCMHGPITVARRVPAGLYYRPLGPLWGGCIVPPACRAESLYNIILYNGICVPWYKVSSTQRYSMSLYQAMSTVLQIHTVQICIISMYTSPKYLGCVELFHD